MNPLMNYMMVEQRTADMLRAAEQSRLVRKADPSPRRLRNPFRARTRARRSGADPAGAAARAAIEHS